MTIKNNIDNAVKKGELIIGLKSVIKALNKGIVSEIIVSLNGRAFIKELKLIAGDTQINEINESSKDLGIKCKKPFNISVLGLKKKANKK